ncbi:PTS system mannose/fructose/sorbose family transporter subunit IID [Rossellomorea marisflavi]|uniref:PTS system mannose/fructose/sorbose family transporter subunit IID n=1 Tax=Rossellomorea marisflavi TaxID=189381 RepID=UPI0035174BAC
MSNESIKLSAVEKKMLNELFWRQNFLMFGINYTRMQGISYGWVMQPLLKKIYKNDEEEYFESLKRNTAFFNTTPQMAPFIMGLTLSMEEEKSKNKEEFDADSINAVKVGLMGPLAGIGDSFFFGTLRVIATGIALGFSQAGNLLGPLLFLLFYNIPGFAVRYYGSVFGYKLGSKYIQKAMESGLLQSITKAATIVGLMMVGAMSYQMVKFSTIFTAKMGGQDFVLQDILDSIMPGLLPLSLVLGTFVLLRKKVNPIYILIGIFALAIVLTLLGITG